MPLIYPDTSRVPIWRRPPIRLEHPIRAWRFWHVAHDFFDAYDNGWYLHSVAANCRWDGPVIRAHMPPVDPRVWEKDKDKAGESITLAGIYALKNKTILHEFMLVYRPDAYGEVDLYGRVAEFTYGYRAEVCMIKKIWLLREASEPIKSLSRRYDCDVEHTPTKL